MTPVQERLRNPPNVELLAHWAEKAADRIDALEAEVAEYRKCADDAAMAHKVERDALLTRLEIESKAAGHWMGEANKDHNKADALEAEVESLQLRNQELAADKEVLLGHMTTIRNVTNDPAISMLTNVVLERMAQGGGK